MITAVYFFGLVMLYRVPYSAAYRAFHYQFFAATGHTAPVRHLPSWKVPAVPAPTPEQIATSLESWRAQLSFYPFVRLSAKPAPDNDIVECGWLVQATGGQVVLLNSNGLLVNSFGDGAFQWRTVAPTACMAPGAPR